VPGLRAWLDGDSVLVVRPGHFPVQSVASLSTTLTDGALVYLDVTQSQLVASGRLIEVLVLIAGGSRRAGTGGEWAAALALAAAVDDGVVYRRTHVGAVPYDGQQACI
jgi:hypothetical protein